MKKLSDLKDFGKLGEEAGGISENWIDAIKGLDEIIEEIANYNKTTPEQKKILEKLLKINKDFPEPVEDIHINMRMVLQTGDQERSEMKYFFVMRTGEKIEIISGGSKSSKDAGIDHYTKFRHTYFFDDTEDTDINTVEFRNELHDLKQWLNSGAEITVSDRSGT